MLQKEHSAILSTFNKLPFTIKTFVLLRQVLLYIKQAWIMEGNSQYSIFKAYVSE